MEYVTNPTTASKLQIDPSRVAVGGDSAGGNLSAAVSCKNTTRLLFCNYWKYWIVLAKQRNQIHHSIKHQVLYYPCVDNDFSTESYEKYGVGFFLTKKMTNEFLKCYAPTNELDNMLLFPNKASVDDLVGLPPALLITCEADVLRDGTCWDVGIPHSTKSKMQKGRCMDVNWLLPVCQSHRFVWMELFMALCHRLYSFQTKHTMLSIWQRVLSEKHLPLTIKHYDKSIILTLVWK